MSYPKEVWKFLKWSQAMVKGATVGSPEYKGSYRGGKKGMKTRKRRKRRRRTRAKKEA